MCEMFLLYFTFTYLNLYHSKRGSSLYAEMRSHAPVQYRGKIVRSYLLIELQTNDYYNACPKLVDLKGCPAERNPFPVDIICKLSHVSSKNSTFFVQCHSEL